jgi:hypothetical protein
MESNLFSFFDFLVLTSIGIGREHLSLLGVPSNQAAERIYNTKSETGELFFIRTVKESEFAYIIVDIIDFPGWFYNKKVFYHKIDNFPLARKFGEDVDFQIRFESLGYSQSNAKKFKIKLNSWDNIELKHR